MDGATLHNLEVFFGWTIQAAESVEEVEGSGRGLPSRKCLQTSAAIPGRAP